MVSQAQQVAVRLEGDVITADGEVLRGVSRGTRLAADPRHVTPGQTLFFPSPFLVTQADESSFIDAATSYWKLLKQNLKYAFILISGDTSLVPLYVDEEYAPSVCSCSCNCFGPNKWVIQKFNYINACTLCTTEPCYRVYCNKYPAEFIMNYFMFNILSVLKASFDL